MVIVRVRVRVIVIVVMIIVRVIVVVKVIVIVLVIEQWLGLNPHISTPPARTGCTHVFCEFRVRATGKSSSSTLGAG